MNSSSTGSNSPLFSRFFVIWLLFLILFSGAISAQSAVDKNQVAAVRAEEVVSKLVKPGMTDFEKILVLYEYITDNLTYGKLNDETSAWTALVHKKADCVGFARGLNLLYQKAGLESFVVVRKKGHLWVKVKLEGKYYNIDPTWGAVKSRWPQYNWFLLSDVQNIDDDKGGDHVLDSGEKFEAASTELVFQDHLYKNKDLLRSDIKLRIMGNVTLPDGLKAPKGGITGTVNGNRFKIPEDKNSAAFFTAIDRKSKAAPVLKYRLQGKFPEELAKEGYLSGNTFVIGLHNADRISLQGPDITGLKLQLQRSRHYISGRVTLPANEVSQKGLSLSLELIGHQGKKRIKYYDTVKIPGGGSSCDYRIDIAEADSGVEYYLYYFSKAAENAGYEKVGYYALEGTLAESQRKGVIKLNDTKARPIDLQLIWRKVLAPQAKKAVNSTAGAAWLKGDLHAHSNYSDGSMPVEAVLSAAEEAGLDFFVITDHNNYRQWNDPAYGSSQLTLLYGAEWTVNLGTRGTGHANIWSNTPFDWSLVKPTLGDFSLKEANASDIKQAIRLVHGMRSPGQELLVSINHPSKPEWLFPLEESLEVDCMEVWNGTWGTTDGDSLKNKYHTFVLNNRPLCMVGGSDSHDAKKIGIPTTWVYAASKDGLEIMRAIREGHTFISDSPAGPQLHLLADADGLGSGNPSNKYEMMMGDSIPAEVSGREIEFKVEVAGAARGNYNSSLVSIIKNGKPFKMERFTEPAYAYTFKDSPVHGDYYRAELRFINYKPGKNLEDYANKAVAAVTTPVFTK